MSETRQFCPRCGDPVERPPDADLPGDPGDTDAALCDACYFESFELVDAPDRIEVRVCSQCGAVHRGNRWVDIGAQDYTDVAVEETAEQLGVHIDVREMSWGVEPEQVDQNTIRMRCLFTGLVRETPVQAEVDVPVYIARQTCDRCGRIAGDYWASLVQVRGANRAPTTAEMDRAQAIAEEYVAEREAAGDREAFITSANRGPDGLDLKLSTNQLGEAIAHRVVREFGGNVSAAETLVTEDGDGNEVYRVTFVARLPEFTPGDVIDLADGDGPVLVTSARGNLKGLRVETGNHYEASHEEGIAPDARKLATSADAVETTLVAIEDERAVQVLDPETYETKTIPRPDYIDTDTDSVRVLKSRAGLHILPNEPSSDRNV